MKWADFRDQIRRTILKDEAKKSWSDLQLRDYIWWALDAFCAHTAAATSVTYPCDGVTQSFQLPANMYEPVDRAGSVSVQAGSSIEYLVPVLYSQTSTPKTERGFYIGPGDTLHIGIAPPSGYSVVVYYYAYYNHPYADTDEITIPQWGYAALAYSVAVYALSNKAVQEAIISQYDTRRDSGTPETLAIKTIQEWWLRLYEQEMARHPRQTRSNTYWGK